MNDQSEQNQKASGALSEKAPGVDRPSRAKNIRELMLAGIAVLSLGLNLYLATRAAVQEQISQPGPHIGRLLTTGLAARTINEVISRNPDVLTNTLGNIGFVTTPEWGAFLEENLPAVALANTEIRFLTIENQTDNLYQSLVLSVRERTIADIGSLRPRTTALVFYDSEDIIRGATLTYTVAGSNASEIKEVTELPRDAIELLTGDLGQGTTVRLLNAIPGENDPLRSLLGILTRANQ